MNDVTKETVQKYIASGGAFCPFCESGDISADTVRSECEAAWQDVECNDCGEEWKDVFYLAQVETTRGQPLCAEYNPQLREDGSLEVHGEASLLTACEALFKVTTAGGVNQYRPGTDTYAAIEQARAAIAKAKGQS